MAEYLVIRLPRDPDDAAAWIAVDSDGTRLGPPVTGPLAEARRDLRDRRVIVLVPGAEVLCTSVDIPVRGAARLQAALPYALEENLAQDVDDLHFAAGERRSDGRIPAAVVSDELMQAWLGRLTEAGIEPSRLVAEHAGLARIPGTVSLLIDEGLVVVNDGGDVELTLEDVAPGDALVAIGALDAPAPPDDDDDEAGDAMPRHVLVYCDAAANERYEHDWATLRQRLESVDVKLLPDGALPRLAATVASGAGINLLQGRYGPKTAYASLLAPWRHAAMLLLALVVVLTAGKGAEYMALAREEAALAERFQAVYAELMPGAPAVEDPLRLVASLRARSDGGGQDPQLLLQALERLGRALGANEDARIEAISYRAGVADIRMNAASVSVLDDIRQRIEQGGGFSARIQSTDQVGERVSSRLQIQAAES